MTTSIENLVDQHDIERAVYSLGRCLDERDFERLRELFTADAAVSTPGGTATGHDALVEQARGRHSSDDGIQHLITNLLVEREGDTARVRANLLVSFAHAGAADPAPFLLGEVYHFELQRTGSGWRIGRLSSVPVWTLNRPAQLAAAL
jgi:hypothetical protein